ncbi:2'-5' RNA ligase family protein [Sphingobacterium deserti]|uniref:2'-5' RNA ligase family protein n=1 Tax=Sphingobacterium deserti TaxID=1229276 RepID=UPI00103F3FC3|nr:2'-5' RNA ligase family protein [Sphingobacterium deserti]
MASLKQRVRNLLGSWYPSCNSIAHISVCRMEVSQPQIEEVIDLLSKAMRYENSQHVYFDHFATYPSSGTFFIDPTVQSKMFLKQKMQRIVAEIEKVIKVDKANAPHLTIGRGLEKDHLGQMQVNAQFKSVDFDFRCASVLLRIFDAEKKRYFPLLEIPFGNEQPPNFETGQLRFNF